MYPLGFPNNVPRILLAVKASHWLAQPASQVRIFEVYPAATLREGIERKKKSLFFLLLGLNFLTDFFTGNFLPSFVAEIRDSREGKMCAI